MKSRIGITDNLGLKMLSLLLGLGLWYAVAGEQGAELAFTIPIELHDLPEGLEVIEESDREAEVRLRGASELLRRLTPQDLNVGVDLSEAEPGEHVLYLTPSDVSVPIGVRVMRVSPSSLVVSLDKSARRRVKVLARVVGSPAEGFQLYNIGLSPRELEVQGPESRLEGTDQITTEPISAEGLREPYSASVRVELDPLVRLSNRTSVDVTLDVREESVRRELEKVPLVVQTGQGPSGSALRTQLRPETVSVLLEGPRSVMERMKPEDLEAAVHVEGLTPGTHQLVPLVRLRRPFERPGVRIVSVVPQQIDCLLSPGAGDEQ